jgi:ParB family transcriptional regulator, chromosome partitioning protein
MQLTTVPLAALLPPKGNPRRTIDTAQTKALARSILVDGLLQNLVVRPESKDRFRVISGKRRYLALQLLEKEGTIDDTYPVPVEIKEDLSDEDAIRLATVENVQREQLNPVDEADAFAKLLHSGGTIEAIVDKTGLATQTVKRRLALATLCSEAKKAFRAGLITRSVAEALTLGTHAQQRSMLESLASEAPPDAEDIREMLLSQKPSVSMAIFPKDRYTGTITTDLFADEETSYFDDVDQFLTLQQAAVEALAREYRTSAAWVEVLNLYTVPWWQYREANEGEPAGVVINRHPTGSVELREGLVRHEVNEVVVESTRHSPVACRTRERPQFSAPLVRYVSGHKNAAVQAALLRHPRKAKEVTALLLLIGTRAAYGVVLSPHPCLAFLAKHAAASSYQQIDGIAANLADRLDIAAEVNGAPAGGISRLVSGSDIACLYDALPKLSDEDLDALVVLLPILCFGQLDSEALDTGESLFNQVAIDLGISMRDWWTPDETFLSGLRREQLLTVANDSGASSRFGVVNGWSKTEIVQALVRYFAGTLTSEAPDDEATQKARTWLPGVLRFPAAETLSID